MATGQHTYLHGRFQDLSGRRFGRLIVRELLGSKNGRCLWRCLCDCGNWKDADTGSLTRKDESRAIRSCGCQHKRRAARACRNRNYRHGYYGTPEYKAWRSMLSRCYYKKDIGYKNYGGRGIKVCDRWRRSFTAFLKDMGRRPSRSHSIDREDTNGITRRKTAGGPPARPRRETAATTTSSRSTVRRNA